MRQAVLAGLTQRKLAEAAATSQANLANIERGEKTSCALVLARTTKALNVPVDHLLGD